MAPNLRYIHWTTRHILVDGMKVEEKLLMQRDHLGMMFDLELCLNREMKAS